MEFAWVFVGIIAIIGVAVGGLIMMFGLPKKGQKPAAFGLVDGLIKQEWTRTGNIDFHAAEIDSPSPQPLTLRVEEKKVTENAMGQDVVELRWRLATLEEAKEIVVCWNARQSEVQRFGDASILAGTGPLSPAGSSTGDGA